MERKKAFKWIAVFGVLAIWSAMFFVDKAGLLQGEALPEASAATDIPAAAFYLEGQPADAAKMRWLLFNTEFELENASRDGEWVQQGDFLFRGEDITGGFNIINVQEKNMNYRKCMVMGFLREHPEVVASYPELQERIDPAAFKIDGINCLHTAGGRGGRAARAGIFVGGGVS